MKIILANPRGFCAGVNMAIESLERALELFGTPLYVYHEIVHNRPIVERFRKRGVVFVDNIAEIPEGATVLYSAHGVAPAIRSASAGRRLRAIDATCPLVTKVHLEAVRFAREGYVIILIGHEGHDEVLGTMGEAPAHIRLVQDAEEVERLDFPPGAKLAYLTQTTLSVDDAEVIINALRGRFPGIVGPSRDDICYATQNRQEAVKELVPQADVVLVLGSHNSSNSMRLAEIAQSYGKPAYLIDSVKEIAASWFTGAETVLVTAGASAPEDAVEECIDYLRRHYGATVESRVIREEHVHFPLPHELRMVAQQLLSLTGPRRLNNGRFQMGWATAYIAQLQQGETVPFRPRGNSMRGKVESGQLCTVEPVDSAALQVGDIVLCKVNGRQYLHLVKAVQGHRFQIGNNRGKINGWVSAGAIYGRCIRVE